MYNESSDEVQVGVDAMLLGQLVGRKRQLASFFYTTNLFSVQQMGHQNTYRTNFELIPFEILLRQRRQQEHDLCFDDGMNIGIGGVVHGWSPSPRRSLGEPTTTATTA